jgi:hypothetical protein
MPWMGRARQVVLTGFATLEAYEQREPSWESDEVFDSVEAATRAARSWVDATGPDAQVEVIELRRRRGKVVRVVTAAGDEDIRPPPFVR